MPPLRQPGAVLLVSCYENGHAPHGIAMPAGFLSRAGYHPQLVDLSVHRLEPAHIDAAMVAIISVPMHTAMRLGLSAAERIRARNPGCAIGFVGLYAAMNQQLLSPLADFTFAGEYEHALVEHLDAMASNPGAPTHAAPQLGKLAFPAPVRTGLPALERYAKLDTGNETRTVGYSETTRGCRDTCAHCPVPAVYRGRLFVIPQDVVLADIGAQVAAGARHITFGDPDFLNGPGHSLPILRAVHDRWPDLSFDITAQVTHLLRHQHVLAQLPALGCSFVVTAVESLSDVVLSRLHKQHRRAQVERVFELARTAGLVLRPTFVPFTPWTTLADIRALFSFLCERGLVGHMAPIQLAIRLLVPPGSLLLEHPDTRDCFGALDPTALTHSWRHADPRVDELQCALQRCVSDAVTASLGDAETFARMRDLVWEASDAAEPPPPVRDANAHVPRLTEPWFC